MSTNREYLGEYGGYQVYRIHDGVLEGWRKDKRVVSNSTTIEGFLAQAPRVKTPKKKTKKQDADSNKK